MNQKIKIYVLCSLFLVAATLSLGYSDGSNFQARTGAPSESTCGISGCHIKLNTGGGTTTITIHNTYTPKETLLVTVTVSKTGQKRWGFELTALSSTGQPRGTFIRIDTTRVWQLAGTNGRIYLKHKSAGTDEGVLNTSPGWTFKWVAPSTGQGPVTFYTCGLAADDSKSQSGDFAYTTSKQITEFATDVYDIAGPTLPDKPSLEQNFPNPFNPMTRIEYQLTRMSPVTIEVFNSLGQKIREFVKGTELPGRYAIDWDGRNGVGVRVASGVYFYRLNAANFVETKSMLLLK